MIKVEPKNSETGDEGTKPQISEFTKEPRLFCVFLWPLESCVCCVKKDKGRTTYRVSLGVCLKETLPPQQLRREVGPMMCQGV